MNTPISLDGGINNTDSSSTTTNSKTFTSGRLYFISVASKTEITSDPNQPTISGGNVTWSLVSNGTVVYDNSSLSRRRLSLFYGICTSTTTETLTIDHSSQVQTTTGWSIVEISSGFNTSSPVVQGSNNSSPITAVTNIGTGLSWFQSPSNISIGFGAIGNGTDSITAGSGFTELLQSKDSVENNFNMLTEYAMSNETYIDMSFVSQSEVGIIGVEVANETIYPTLSWLKA